MDHERNRERVFVVGTISVASGGVVCEVPVR